MIEKIKRQLHSELERALKVQFSIEVPVIVEEPKRANQGDISVPVFPLVKAFSKPLVEVVDAVRSLILETSLNEYFESVDVFGGFINITLKKQKVASAVIADFMINSDNIGSCAFGKDKTICIDYSSPNIAKPFSIGHLRSTIIGHALGNILEKCGYKIIRINHLGDFGTQFGKIIYAYIHYGSEEAVKKNPIAELEKLYVLFHEKAKKDPELESKAREIFRDLEQNDPKYQSLWSWFREESLKEYMQVYKKLNVNFDSYDGEAFYNDKMKTVIDELKAKALLVQDEGAMIVDLGAELPPALIQKSDGSTLYITRDLAALFYRKATYDFHKCLYVVGNEQKLHFEQLKRVVGLMGYPYSEDIVHVNFGLVLQDGKKMSTRKGKTVKLIDVLDEAVSLSLDYIVEKNPDLPGKEEIAEKVGVSAIIFNDLKNYRGNDFEFNLQDMVNFFGQTGPYLQYTSVRINSILAQAEFQFTGKVDGSWFEKDHVYELMKTIGSYGEIIEKSALEYAPNLIAKYLLNLASLFNTLYGKDRILVEDIEEKQTKLHVLYMVRAILNDGMNLLGMQIIERM
ncbi:MAG: arginine--tRNA ligase [Candidatus Izemoplasmatales bacterium]|nr:arginine--tRNA ligase [Candidatus Izemoplasmatales bacterium]